MNYSNEQLAAIMYVRSRKQRGRTAADLDANGHLTTIIDLCKAEALTRRDRIMRWVRPNAGRNFPSDLDMPMDLIFFIQHLTPSVDRKIRIMATEAGVPMHASLRLCEGD